MCKILISIKPEYVKKSLMEVKGLSIEPNLLKMM